MMLPTGLYYKLTNPKYFFPDDAAHVKPYPKMDHMDISSHFLLGKSIKIDALRFGFSSGLRRSESLVLVFEGLSKSLLIIIVYLLKRQVI